jgi:hypothetical protein
LAITAKTLKYPAQLTASAAAQVTGASGKTTYIKLVVLHNTDASGTYTVTLYHYASGGSASASNEVWKVDLAPGETLMIEFAGPGLVLAQGDVLSGLCDTASKVTIGVYGGEE